MATLFDADKVKYLCSCKRLKPLCYLYYCKYCKPFTLKCKDCVLHEIDQKYYCANCFDNKAQKEVIAVKYKCSNCFSCPYCNNLLMIRASSAKSSAQKESLGTSQSSPALPSSAENSPSVHQSPQPNMPQKVFYLMCGFCRWTTRDVGIPDVTSAPGGWKLQENPNSKRIHDLMEAYKIVAAREKLERDRKKHPTIKRRTFHLTSSTSSNSISSSSFMHGDKYGILAPAQKRLQMASNSASNQNSDPIITIEQQFKSLIQPPTTVDSFEKLPDDIFTKELNLNSITTINQRHANPEFQPAKSSDLYPLNKHYQSKESKRCTGCEHNVLKPESNITSIKFKLHQMAIFIVPEIRIVTIPEWTLNKYTLKPNEVILSITNRYETDINVGFVSLDDGDSTSTNISGFRPTASIKFDIIDENSTVLVERQDTSKFQVTPLKQIDLDTKGFVCFRRDNKIAVVCKVTPFNDQQHDKNEPVHVRCVFGLKCSANIPEKSTSQSQGGNTPTSTPQANPQDLQVSSASIVHKIFVDFGPLKLEDGLRVVPRPRYIDDCLKASNK